MRARTRCSSRVTTSSRMCACAALTCALHATPHLLPFCAECHIGFSIKGGAENGRRSAFGCAQRVRALFDSRASERVGARLACDAGGGAIEGCQAPFAPRGAPGEPAVPARICAQWALLGGCGAWYEQAFGTLPMPRWSLGHVSAWISNAPHPLSHPLIYGQHIRSLKAFTPAHSRASHDLAA